MGLYISHTGATYGLSPPQNGHSLQMMYTLTDNFKI